MADPAIEAAQQVVSDMPALDEASASQPMLRALILDVGTAAAREALKQVRDDLQLVDGVLGLLHRRGLVDTEQNRADVKAALEIVQRYTRG